MPGRFRPPSVGSRPAHAQQIMATVYEKKRQEGLPQARAARIAWGAVKHAGYDPARADILRLQQEDEELEYRQYRKIRGHPQDLPAFKRAQMDPMARQIRQSGQQLFRSGTGAFRTGVRHARTIHGLASRVRQQVRRRPIAMPTVRPRKPLRSMKGPDARLYADPARLPEPDDYAGYDNLNLVRLVPSAEKKGHVPIKRLMEGQIVLPPHQWQNIAEKVQDWPDVQFSDEDKDGAPDRIIRRGHKNYQTNLFIDKA